MSPAVIKALRARLKTILASAEETRIEIIDVELQLSRLGEGAAPSISDQIQLALTRKPGQLPRQLAERIYGKGYTVKQITTVRTNLTKLFGYGHLERWRAPEGTRGYIYAMKGGRNGGQ